MQRLLLIAGSALALTACTTMDGLNGHHTPYAKLGKIAKQHDVQQALLQTREGNFVVVNVLTGEIVKPSKKRKVSTAENHDGQKQDDTTAKKISDERFAEIQRKFERTITIKVIRGSICKVDVIDPPGDAFEICHPDDPKWWND